MPAPKSARWPRKIPFGNVSVTVYRLRNKATQSGYEYAVVWNAPTGRKKRSFADEKRALTQARQIAQQLNSGHVDAAQMTNAEREEWATARQLTGTTPLLAALREWHRANEMTHGQIIPAAEQFAARSPHGSKPIIVARAICTYLRARKADGIKTELGAERTLNSSRVANSFRDRFGGKLLAEVTTNDLALWLEGYQDPITRNTHRKRVVALFRWARKRGYLPLDTLTAAERTDTAQERAGEVEVISAATLRTLFALIASEHPHYVPALTLAAFCGMRSAEVHGQVWEDFDWKRRFLRVSLAKPRTPARRHVPLSETALSWLRAHRVSSGPLCTNLALHRIRIIGRGHGIALPKNCFRHTFISAQVEITGDIPRTALEAGNSPQQIHAHYRQLITREEAQAWFAVRPSSVD